MRATLVVAFGVLLCQTPGLGREAGETPTGAVLVAHVQKLHEEGKFAEALPAVRSAAEMGDQAGLLLAGAIHEFGWGVAADAATAARQYEKAAASDGYAALVLGQLYARGGPNLKPDKAASEKWLAAAAQKGFRGAEGDAARHPAGTLYQAAAARRAQAASTQFDFRGNC